MAYILKLINKVANVILKLLLLYYIFCYC